MVRTYIPVNGALTFQDADDLDEDDEGDEDIDDIGYAACALGGNASTPLLCQDEEDSADAPCSGNGGSARASRWMRSIVGKKPKGFCPLCGEKVRSGAHLCSHAQLRLREAALANEARTAGNIAFRARRFDEALAAYTRALHHTPDDAALWSNRAAARTALIDAPQLSKEAVADCDETIRLAPSWPKGYLRKAKCFEIGKDWVTAAEIYERALANCQGAQDAAKIKRGLGNARARNEYARRARALPQAFSEASMHSRWMQLKNAGAELVLCPKDCEQRLLEAEAAKSAGNAKVAKQVWQEAIVCYEHGLRRLRSWCAANAPSEAHCRLEVALMLNLAISEFHLGHHKVTEAYCTDALKLDAFNIKAWMRRAVALGEREEYDSALDDVEMGLLVCTEEDAALELRLLQRRLHLRRQALRRRQKEQATRMLSWTGR